MHLLVMHITRCKNLHSPVTHCILSTVLFMNNKSQYLYFTRYLILALRLCDTTARETVLCCLILCCFGLDRCHQDGRNVSCSRMMTTPAVLFIYFMYFFILFFFFCMYVCVCLPISNILYIIAYLLYLFCIFYT